MHRKTGYLSFVHAQRGAATLVVALILLIVTSVITVYGARNSLMEQRITANDYRAVRLAEAAEAGLDYGITWLAGNASSLVWVNETTVPYNVGYQKSSNTITTNLGTTHGLSVFFRRLTNDSRRLQVVATAYEKDANGVNTSVSRTSTTSVLPKTLASSPTAPLVVDPCLGDVQGNPKLVNLDNANGPLIATSAAAAAVSGCVNLGNYNKNPSDPPISPSSIIPNAFTTGTLWDRTFGITQAEMQAAAAAQEASIPSINDRTIIWNTDPSKFSYDIGTAANPAILIMTACQKLGSTVYGIVYYLGDCSLSAIGWGGTVVNGTIISEGTIPIMNSNHEIFFSTDYFIPLQNKIVGVSARIPGTWLDDNV